MRKMGKKLVIMVCIAAMIMTNLPNWDAGADVSGTVWSETGDTLIGNAGLGSKEIIMGDRFIENETLWNDTVITLNGNLTVNETGNLTISNVLLTLNGNLTVNETGKLTLDNVTLLMNCSENGSYHIEVLSGGEMRILNNSNISSANEYHYLFWVRNDSKFEMRDSELHECGYNYPYESAGLWINTDGAIIENCILSQNYKGIILDGSNHTAILNTTISHNSNDGIFFTSSMNSSIGNSTINNNYHGIALDSSINNIIIDSTIYNVSDGFQLAYSSYNIITNCTIHNADIGIYLGLSSKNTITNCTIYNSSQGIQFSSSLNNIVENCTIYNSSSWGIYMSSASDYNNITNCTIYNSYHGIEIDWSSNNTITNCTLYNNSHYGIYIYWTYLTIYPCPNNTKIINCAIYNNSWAGIRVDSSLNTGIINCVIYNCSSGVSFYNSSTNAMINSTLHSNFYDIYLQEISTLHCLNTTFDKSNVQFPAGDFNSTLNVSWYLNVNVLWNNSIPAEYADVTVFDNLVNEVFNGSTDKNGLIKDIVVQEYTQNQTAGKISFTPHNVTASQGGISSSNVTVVNETKTIELLLDHNAPEINETTISPEQEYSTDENTTIEFEFNVSHPDNLTLTYHWYLYMNETEVKNATGILENTTTPQKINWTHYFDFTSHGNYTVKVEVSDTNATVSYTWVLTVNDVNGKPEIEFYYPPKDIILSNHSCVIFNVTASDPDNNDEISYQWTSNGAPVSNENKYIFYAEYNASGNATNTYLIELVITDNGTPPKSVNHTWTVTVVDIEALYADLLNQTELLEELTELISKISYVCANLNQSNLDELNITLHKFYEKYNVLLNQTGLFENIKGLMEQIEDLTEQFSESQDNVTTLRSLLDELNITLEQLNVNLTSNWDALNSTTEEKNDAENKTKEMENKMNNAIEAKNKAEYKLGASVVCGVIGGIIAGFLVSFLLRRKLPKKG